MIFICSLCKKEYIASTYIEVNNPKTNNFIVCNGNYLFAVPSNLISVRNNKNEWILKCKEGCDE